MDSHIHEWGHFLTCPNKIKGLVVICEMHLGSLLKTFQEFLLIKLRKSSQKEIIVLFY